MSAAGTFALWSHALAALLFGGLAVIRLREGGDTLPRVSLIAALALSALWALAVAGIDGGEVAPRVAEAARNAGWFCVLFALARPPGTPHRIARAAAFGTVIALCALVGGLAVAGGAPGSSPVADVRLVLRMVVAITGLVMVHQLAVAAPRARGGVRLLLTALALLWATELAVLALTWAGTGWSDATRELRGSATVAVAALLAIALHRGGDWTLSVSRTVAVRAFAGALVAGYVLAVALAARLLGALGGGNARIMQTALVAGAAATLIVLVGSPWLRAWIKVKVAKHVYGHRYDYRHEWLRFTATLARGGADAAAPLAPRLVQALADLTDSPAGLLLVATGDALEPGGDWNWAGAQGPASRELVALLTASERIFELAAPGATRLPHWLAHHADAWVVVPLVHRDRLAGAVVLARPPLARALDWEDFDLLRVAGRQAGSYLAEARAAAALAEAQRFDEFNRRFAFIVHDVKNLVSQLTLVARNAQRHADNPAFRADMVATLQDSCGRMSALLQRLSQHGGGRVEPPVATDLAATLRRTVAARWPRAAVTVSGQGSALVDPARLEQVVAHLVQNALEAGSPDVAIVVAGAGIAVVDHGCGMSAGFVRDELFRPFASTRDGGFGIGAFEARQLTQAMGGAITVLSTPGEGTRFVLTFPPIPALEAVA